MTNNNRETRRLAICEWLKRHDVDPNDVLADIGGVTATPLNEGELVVTYAKIDPRVFDVSIPIAEIVNHDGKIPTTPVQFRTSEAPPGFKLPKWDAWLYMWGRRPIMPYPVAGGSDD